MHRWVPPAVHTLVVWADQLSTAGEIHTHGMNYPFLELRSGSLLTGLLLGQCGPGGGRFFVAPQRLTHQVEAVILLHHPVQNCVGYGGAYCALGVIANGITPSVWERVIWLPVTLMLLASSIVVAKGP